MERTSFTLIVTFSVWSLDDYFLTRSEEKFSWLRKIFQKKNCPFLQQRIFPIEYQRDVLTRISSDEFDTYVIVIRNTGSLDAWSLKSHFNCELWSLRESVYTLYASVDPSDFFFVSCLAKYCHVPNSAEKFTSWDTWIMTMQFFSVVTCFDPWRRLFLYDVSDSWGLLLKVPDLRVGTLLDFDYLDQICLILYRKCRTDWMTK